MIAVSFVYLLRRLIGLRSPGGEHSFFAGAHMLLVFTHERVRYWHGLCNFFLAAWLGQKSRRTKVPRIFRIFIPNFAPNSALDFPRICRGVFVLRFVVNGDNQKFPKNPRHFSMQNSQANTEKKFTKGFWRGDKGTSRPSTLGGADLVLEFGSC